MSTPNMQSPLEAPASAKSGSRERKLLEIINHIKRRTGSEVRSLDLRASLRDDLGFDSMDLAELTVRIEDEFGVDVFERGIVRYVGEVIGRISE